MLYAINAQMQHRVPNPSIEVIMMYPIVAPAPNLIAPQKLLFGVSFIRFPF